MSKYVESEIKIVLFDSKVTTDLTNGGTTSDVDSVDFGTIFG